jgi:transcriptional regulator with XRE-family HTH domain
MQEAVQSTVAAGNGSPERARGVGADLRALRKARGLTLTGLALKVGRSVGWLSQVERDLAEPTISDLRRLATALDQPLSLFFGPAEAPERERGYVVRRNARRSLGSAAEGLTEQLLSPDLSGSFEIVRSVFDPGAERIEYIVRPTEEAGYLIAGELEMWIGERHFHLKPGDSFRFRGERYRWRNSGTEPAVAIWVIAPPVY